jgi:hypothetical protein
MKTLAGAFSFWGASTGMWTHFEISTRAEKTATTKFKLVLNAEKTAENAAPEIYHALAERDERAFTAETREP